MPWIPEILKEEGFRTGAMLVDYPVFKSEWNMGYNRGFELFDTSTPVEMRDGMFYGFPSGELVEKINRFIDEAGTNPFMVWTHLVEPHAAYERQPGAPDFGDDEEGLYASDIWAADKQVGRLISHLDERGLLNNTVVLITGDHGEAFGEHGEKHHYSSVHESQVRTLGLLYVPGLGHRMVKQAVIHQDLTTTAMNLLGVKRDFDQLRGRNLIPTFRGFRVEPDEIFPELAGFQVRVQSFSLVRWPFKMIHPRGSKTYRLYDLEKDPGETVDVATQYQSQYASMRERMTLHVETIGTPR
jgi:arylsulfatase A-like enzyme